MGGQMARRQGPGVTAQFLPGVTLGSPGVWDKGSDSSITVGLRASMLGLSVQVPSAWGPGAGLGGDKVQELDQEGKRPRSWIRRDGGPGAGPGGIGRWGAEMRPEEKQQGTRGSFCQRSTLKIPRMEPSRVASRGSEAEVAAG